VQDADNFNNTVGGYPIKDDVTSLRILSVARAYLIAGLPHVRILTEKMEALIELKNVVVSLIPAPFTFRVNRN